MSGRAVQVVQSKDNCITLDIPALEEILLDEKVRGKKVVLISVAGAYRKGKSFFLCFLLRYLKAKGSSEWMGGPNEPLEGFIWKNSTDAITNGILMWSEVFIITMPNNEEVAVILLDTEGTFAYNSPVKNCATIFALSTLLSSVQVYNLSNLIQATDLHHLQLFTEYGKFGLNKSTQQTSFQDLLFLIRNWEYPATEEYGMHGGENYLNRVLKTEENQTPELKDIRLHLRSSFNHISCFLMPHPGKTVATGAHCNGRLADIDAEFKQHLAVLVPMLLSPDKLVIKEVNGKQITAEELVKYFKAYMTRFQGEKNLPPIKSLYEATAEVNNQIAVDDAKKCYKTSMDDICSGKPSMSSTELNDKHLRNKETAIKQFQDTKTMGQTQFSEKYKKQLMMELDKIYEDYKKSNKAKKEAEDLKIKIQQKEELETAVDTARVYYHTLMDEICCSGKPSISSLVLDNEHLKRKEAAITQFQNTGKRMEGQLSCEYEQKLITELDKMYEDYKKSNKAKKEAEDLKLKIQQKEELETAVHTGRVYYQTLMDKICCSGKPSMSSAVFENKHMEMKKAAITQFQNTGKRMEGQLSYEYEQKLITELDKMYEDYKKSNKTKKEAEDLKLKIQQKEELETAVDTAKGYYQTLMDEICCSGKPSMRSSVLENEHLKRKEAAITQFQNTGKMMEGQLSCEYEQKLIMELDNKYEDCKKSNEMKHIQEEMEQQLVIEKMKMQNLALKIGTAIGTVAMGAAGIILGPAGVAAGSATGAIVGRLAGGLWNMVTSN